MTNNSSKEKKPMLLDRLEMQEEIEHLNQDVDSLNRLHEIGMMLNAALDLDEILISVVDNAVSISSAEEGLLMLIDNSTGELFARAQKGFQEEFTRKLRQQVEDSIAKDAIASIKSQRWTSKDKILKLTTGYYVNAVVYIPLVVENKVIGVLSVDNHTADKPFTKKDELLLGILANYAAIAIRNASLVNDLTTRTNILTSLHETGKSIISIVMLKDVLEQIAEEAFKLLKANSIVLYQYFAQDDDIIIPPIIRGALKNQEHLGKKSPNHKQSSVFKLIRNGQPFYASDAKNDWIREGLVEVKDQPEDNFLFREGINSSAGIPLIADEEPVGLMFVNYLNKKLFSPQEKEIIGLLSNQAAIAIQNARLLDDKEASIKELKSLVETSRVVTSSPTSLKNVLQVVADHTKLVVHADYALVFPIDKKTGEFWEDLITVSGVAEHDILMIHPPRLAGMTQLIRDKGLLIIEDTGNSQKYPFIERTPDSFIIKYNIRMVVGIALWAGQDFIGILYADFCGQRRLSEDKIRILQLFANQAAVSIQNANLFEEVNQHIKELSALNQIGQALSASEVSGIDGILEDIYKYTKGLMDVDNFYVALYDEDQNKVYFKIAIENDQPQILGQGDWAERINRNGLTEYVIRSKKPEIVSSSIEFNEYQVEKIGKRAACWLGIPMMVGDKVLGVIAIQSDNNPHAYNEHHKDILLTIAAQTAIAIENANLLQEQKLRLDESTALYDISLDIIRELDQEQLLQAIVERAAGLLNAPSGCIILCDAEKKELEMKYTYNLDVRHGQKFIFGQGMIGYVAQTGESLYVDKYHPWGGRDAHLDGAPDKKIFNSVVLAALRWQDKVLGVLAISDTKEERKFSKEDLRLLERFANQASIAFHNANLFNDKVKEIEALRNADIAILSVLESDKVLSTILEELTTLTKFDCILIRLYDEEKKELIFKESKGIFEGKIPASIKSDSGSISARAAMDGKTIMIEDVEKDSVRQAFIETINDPDERLYLMWVQSQAAVPLVAKDRVIGVMTAQSHNRSGFYQADAELLKSFASPAAIAIENARQYTELEQTKGVVLARTAIAWMGMANSDLRHAIGNDVPAIEDYIELARRDIVAKAPSAKILERLDRIVEIVAKIQKAPITAPLYNEEGVRSVIINELVKERINQLWMHERYRDVPHKLDFRIGGPITVRVSPDWLRRVFDIVIDNAVDAMSSVMLKQLTIITQLENNGIALIITDNGRGIPDDVLPQLFHTKIFKPKGSKGLGMGLLMADLIVQIYDGKLGIVSTGPSGTIMKIWLPIES